ncbi:MAG: hypothetical protein KBT67_07415 [bacterium]|nr:hypothetical protein [Candidatus Limimorpha caballi]
MKRKFTKKRFYETRFISENSRMETAGPWPSTDFISIYNKKSKAPEKTEALLFSDIITLTNSGLL